MIIIVEGPNNVGKSTFIKKLLKKLPNYTVEHTSVICPNNFEYYKLCLSIDNIIYDRLHIGEIVYPQIYSRKQNINDEEFKYLMNYKNVIYVFIDADLEFILKGAWNKGEKCNFVESMNEKKLFNQVFNLISNLIDDSNVFKIKNHLCNEYEDNDVDLVINEIVMRCKNEIS